MWPTSEAGCHRTENGKSRLCLGLLGKNCGGLDGRFRPFFRRDPDLRLMCCELLFVGLDCLFFLCCIILNLSASKFYLRDIRNTFIESIFKYFIYESLLLNMGMVFRILTNYRLNYNHIQI